MFIVGDIFRAYGSGDNIGILNPFAGRTEKTKQEEPVPVIAPAASPPVSPAPSGSEISFTTSSYGSPIPIIFGSDKITGNVIWASPTRTTFLSDGQSFYQSVDFALGLCEGAIDAILRIWLGEKMIMDLSARADEFGVMQPSSTGWISGTIVDLTDPDSPLRSLTDDQRLTTVDFYAGSETQLADPTIVAAEGYDYAPAYRGTSYVLFRNFVISSSSSIPNIFVEVLSNNVSPRPRLYGTYPDPEYNFDRPSLSNSGVIVDQRYGTVHIASRNSADIDSISRRGFASFNHNNLEYLTEVEIDTTLSQTPSDYDYARLLPTSGNILLPRWSGNAGIVYVINPYAGIITDTFGPGGGISDHNPATGFSALGKGSLAFSSHNIDTFEPVDVFMGVGYLNGSIGFAEIDSSGQLTFIKNLSNVMTYRQSRATTHTIDPGFPTFLDGTPSAGQWVWVANWGGISEAVGTTSEIKIGRMKVIDENGISLINDVVYSEPHTISVDNFRGAGIQHFVSSMFVDPSDNCLVIFGLVSGGTSFVFKYSPFTGLIVWKSDAPGYINTGGNTRAHITDRRYAWVSPDNESVYDLNLDTGEVVLLDDSLDDYGVPLAESFEQYYNGAERSITYVSDTNDQRVVKLFLDKNARAPVSLGHIIKNLLFRVGLQHTDMNISDVNDVTLHGYTVTRPQSLRACFSELAQAFKYDVVESNGKLRYLTRGKSATTTIPKKWFGEVTEQGGWLNAKDSNDISRIRKISLTYRDIGREYKDNVQSIYLPNTSFSSFDNDFAIDVKVPIVLTAPSAKTIAEILLYTKLVYDTTYEAVLPERYAYLDPGDVIRVQPDDNSQNDFHIRIKKVSLGADKVVKIEATPEDSDVYNDTAILHADTGRYIEPVFPPITPNIDVVALDIPFRSYDEAADAGSNYRLYFSFLNLLPGPTPVRAFGVVINGRETYTIEAPDHFPTWGYVETPPVARSALFSTDNVSTLRVKMISTSGSSIASASHEDLLASDQANLCWVGGELLQFTNVVNEGGGYYTFTGLHRAKFNTSAQFGKQVAGSRFILLGDSTGALDTGGIGFVDVTSDKSPSMVAQIFARTDNPFQPTPIMNTFSLNRMPWSVAGFDGEYDTITGDCELKWQRRTRLDAEWPDDGDETAPINEIDESYVVFLYTDATTFDIENASTYLRRVEVTSNGFTYTDAMQTADGFNRATTDLFIVVFQQGSVTGFRAGTASSHLLPHL